MDISKITGAYSKELKENIGEITNIFEDSSISVEAMKQAILDIIEPARIDVAAKPRFKYFLDNCRTKLDIYNLCWNSICKAMRYGKAV
jgi:hypothetical protein